MLTHYTRSAEAVGNILTHGFGWMPRRRRLAHVLCPEHDFSRREPQQFGMVCFTDLVPPHTDAHCAMFGQFGIVVSEAWATQQGAQRVIYIDETGPIADALKVLFAIGYADVAHRIKYPNDGGWRMAFENKNAASAIAGSKIWAHLLQLWEYLEPANSAPQREWRIVNQEPFYGLSEDTAEAISQISPPLDWAKDMNVLPCPRSAVQAVICRSSDRQKLQALLPPSYSDISIVETPG